MAPSFLLNHSHCIIWLDEKGEQKGDNHIVSLLLLNAIQCEQYIADNCILSFSLKRKRLMEFALGGKIHLCYLIRTLELSFINSCQIFCRCFKHHFFTRISALANFQVPEIEVPNFIKIPRSGHVTFFFMIMKQKIGKSQFIVVFHQCHFSWFKGITSLISLIEIDYQLVARYRI